MIDFDLSTSLGRDVSSYNRAVDTYRQKLADYNNGLSNERPQAPKNPLDRETAQSIAQALQNQGNADYVRDAPGMISAVLGRKADE